MTSNLKLYSCKQKKVKHLNPVIAIGTVYFCTEFSISCIYITGGFLVAAPPAFQPECQVDQKPCPEQRTRRRHHLCC